MSMWGDMPRSKLVSPNEIYAQAKIEMLNGRDPVTAEDYARIMNYLAANVAPEIALNACLLLRTIFQMPLTDEDVTDIVRFQLKENN